MAQKEATTKLIKNFIKKTISISEVGPLLAIIILVIVLSINNSHFLTISNLLNVARQISMMSTMAVGMAGVLISGEIDLSVGATLGIASCLLAIMLKGGINPFLAVFSILVLGIIIGILNGVLVTKIGIPSLIVTLGASSIIRGLAFVLTGGWPVSLYGNPRLTWIAYLGAGKIFGFFPMQAVFMIIVLIIGSFILQKTALGYHIFAIGGNTRAAELSGISIFKTKLIVFAIAGSLAALAGILSTGFTAQADANYGTLMELDVIAASVIGGVSIKGGKGSILGVFLGAVILGILLNGLVLLGISPFIQKIFIGVVIIGAVGFSERVKYTGK